MEHFVLREALMDTDDETTDEEIIQINYGNTSPTIQIQQVITAQPIVLLNDINLMESPANVIAPDIISSSSNSSPTNSIMEVVNEPETIPSPIKEENSKESEISESSESKSYEDDGQTCPICLDNWTNSGEHRLCSLKCGHLFGHSCITRWLASLSKKSCPTCKKRVMRHDLRFIYAKKLVAMDTTELDKIKDELETITAERNKIQLELSKFICKEHSLNQEINSLKAQLNMYKNNPMLFSAASSTQSLQSNVKLYIDKSLDVCPLGGCRVFDANPSLDLIVVNVKSPNSLFAGFGLRKISLTTYKPLAFLPLHSSQIRDISFQNTKVLTVSMDKSFKITDSTSNSNICTLNQSVPLWSCCWDTINSNYFYVGSQTGTVSKFDMRNTEGPLNVLGVPGDFSPVVSVAHVPNGTSHLPLDGVISCKLNSLWFFENSPEEYARHLLTVDGPFYSLKFEPVSRQFLVSSRPNNRNPNSRHTLAYLEKSNEKILTNVVYTFENVGMQRHMSRSCFIKNIGTGGYVATHEESNRLINLWDIQNGTKITTVPAHDPVLDLNSVTLPTNNTLLIGLTEKKMLFYKFV